MFYKITRNLSDKVKALADMYKVSGNVNKELFTESLTEVIEELKSIRSQVNEICGTEIKDRYEYKSYGFDEGIADMFNNNNVEDLIKDFKLVIEEVYNNPN